MPQFYLHRVGKLFAASNLPHMRRRKRSVVLTVDDTAWKAFTDDVARLEAILKHGLPRLHAHIDWSRGVEFLDKELTRVAPKEFANLQVVDKLFRVYLRDGTEE
jgi:hypothetical protein